MIKKCNYCGDDYETPNHQRQFCDSCNEIKRKISYKKYQNKKSEINNDISEIQFRDNFYDVTDEPFKLTTTGFSLYSKISHISYTNKYCIPWIKIVDKYGKLQELYNYVLEEYKNYMENSNSKSIKNFINNHKYISECLIKHFGINKIKEDLKIKKNRYTSEELKEDFMKLYKECNGIPSYDYFIKNAEISITSYKYHLKLGDKGKVYKYIIEEYIKDKNEIDLYYKKLKEIKSNLTRNQKTGNNKYSDEELKSNLVSVFDKYYDEYGQYPSRRLFDKISKCDSSTYRKRFNCSWNNVCIKLGYDYSLNANVFENHVLKTYEKILNEKCIRQKTFDWLKGIKNFPLFIDGVFLEHKICIEADGKQHKVPMKRFGGYETFNRVQGNDKMKNKLIPEHGYKLIRVDIDSDWMNEEYLRELLG